MKEIKWHRLAEMAEIRLGEVRSLIKSKVDARAHAQQPFQKTGLTEAVLGGDRSQIGGEWRARRTQAPP